MTLKQLKAFLMLTRTLNYAQAADELCITQSALSLSIKSLEEELGGKLFYRNTRKVNLTPEGNALIPFARKLLSNWEDMEKDVKQRFQLNRGTLNIASMPFAAHAILPQVLQQFSQQYPNISYSIHDIPNEKIIEKVQDGIFELGLCFRPTSPSNLNFQLLFEEDFVAIVPKHHALALREQIALSELCRYPFITLQQPSIVRNIVEACCQENQLILNLKVECHQISSLSQFIAQGMGVSVIPRHYQQFIDTAHNKILEIEQGNVRLQLGLIYKQDIELSNLSKQFMLSVLQQFSSDA